MTCELAGCDVELTRDQIRKGCRFCSQSCSNRSRRSKWPMCQWCGDQRVNRKRAKYCSRSCVGHAQKPHTAKMLECYRKKHHERAWKQVIEDSAAAMREIAGTDGRVPFLDAAKAAVRVALKHRRVAYERGYSACWHGQRTKLRNKGLDRGWRQSA